MGGAAKAILSIKHAQKQQKPACGPLQETKGSRREGKQVKIKNTKLNTIVRDKRCAWPMRLAGGYYESWLVKLSGGSGRAWSMHEQKTPARPGRCLLICKAISALSCTVSKKPCSGVGGFEAHQGGEEKKPFVIWGINILCSHFLSLSASRLGQKTRVLSSFMCAPWTEVHRRYQQQLSREDRVRFVWDASCVRY